MVVKSPCVEKTGLFPVFIKRKQPVPYVFLALPAVKQFCPNNADCWSPATPVMGISPPNIDLCVFPK